ncbi:extracellular solute-binding protein [Paenibacillus sp. ACRRX]|uniref:ABC transporter substrate-binding protein n=1 Tax=unclassified Paenibacillus TaxID=185978 RepID=UPI001EF70C56|nr:MULTISPECIES: extracellular solute-binding protein [unclassified Paenibacillus]MCG7410040.1 extracellular solute-binding protein [Paenibacillus sp. ACRRX]MDK8183990.1 extracellular solute-binding protein [Paenibacillus sp. UMB4589-SE434]
MLQLHKSWKVLLASMMILVLLSGCMGEKPVLEKMPENGGKLKVMYWDEELFYRFYGNFFSIKYQNVDFEVVNMNAMDEENQDKEFKDPNQKLLEFVEKEKPDIIMLDQEQLPKLAEKGKLYNLDPILAQEQVDMKDMLPGVIDMFRELGDGNLYALTPYYYGSAVYYNADLFKAQGVELPKHQMSWEELLNLAARFNKGSGEDQTYGIANQFSESYDFLMDVAQSTNLQVLDSRNEKVLLHTDGWKNSFKLVTDAIRNKAYKLPEQNNNGGYSSFNNNEFMSGKAAMAMEGSWFIYNIVNMTKYEKDNKPFEWGMVTMPVNPSRPDESPYISFNGIYAINQDSPNKPLAWEFLKFMSGPEMAKAASKNLGDLPIRTTYLKEIGGSGKSAEAFTMLKPSLVQNIRNFRNKDVPKDFETTIRTLVGQAIDDVVANKKSIDEALAAIQQELQMKLDTHRNAAENSPKK